MISVQFCSDCEFRICCCCCCFFYILYFILLFFMWILCAFHALNFAFFTWRAQNICFEVVTFHWQSVKSPHAHFHFVLLLKLLFSLVFFQMLVSSWFFFSEKKVLVFMLGGWFIISGPPFFRDRFFQQLKQHSLQMTKNFEMNAG